MNSEIPKFPVVGSELSATQMRGVVNAIRRFMPIAGNGIRISRTLGGTVISAAPQAPAAVAAKQPWTFSCSVQKDENGQETGRTGGWTNCKLQIGLDIDWASEDLKMGIDDKKIILGTKTANADGAHYLKVSLGAGDEGADLAEIVVPETPPTTDSVTGVLFIKIGTVYQGSLVEPAPHFNPVIYKYL